MISYRKLVQNKVFGLSLLFSLFVSSTFALNINHSKDISVNFAAIDKATRKLNMPISVEALAQEIGQYAYTDWEKTRAIYIWLCHNISYDVEAFFSSSIPDQNPEDVFSQGMAVCEGYANLALQIANYLEIEMVKVSGYAKGYGFERGMPFLDTNHAWNAFCIEGRWYLMDATWGAGYINEKHQFVRDETTTWFAMDPYLFYMTHYPEDESWTLLENHISLDEYVQMPYIESYVFQTLWRNDFTVDEQYKVIDIAFNKYSNNKKLGDKLADILSLKQFGFTKSDIIAFLDSDTYPKSYSFPGSLKVVNVPQMGVLQKGKTYTFAVKVPDAKSVAVICGSVWHYLFLKNGVYSIELKIFKGPIQIAARLKGQNSYYTAIEYSVR